MGIKAVPQLPFSPDVVPSDFCLFPKLKGCRYETIEEMKEAVTKVIDTLTQEDFHGAFQKLFFLFVFYYIFFLWSPKQQILQVDWPILWFQVQMNSYSSNWNTPY